MTSEVLRTALEGLLSDPSGKDEEDLFICRPLPTEYRGMVYAFIMTKPRDLADSNVEVLAAQQALQHALREQQEVRTITLAVVMMMASRGTIWQYPNVMVVFI